MSHIAYYRVSDSSQSIKSQKAALTHAGLIEDEFKDEGVSGAIPAADRTGFAAMLAFVRKGDTIHVYAVDRLGRDAIDVQTTIRALLKKGVTVHVNGLGPIGPGVGELIVAVLAQVADMERARINERTAAGRTLARASLAATGLTHRGKESLGRPAKGDSTAVKAWRAKKKASISEAAKHFGLSDSTVKRYCAA
ncbi:recombinase family protein [Massilia sp. TWR1-2-2]|uniref:recombinase family protein n=1 Tax=Massilia sp. TWR1-2-2 TaxID=2804584 RepID=UPI003CE9F708